MYQLLFLLLSFYHCTEVLQVEKNVHAPSQRKADGYRGIWYMNQPSGDLYVYKYSGGLGTYCAKHQPFAIYNQESDKTFFCYGGTTDSSNRQLLHMVSYYDHKTKMVPKPTILLNKHTDDAHDNPVISIDDEGYIWIFSTSHGTSRPSFIHKSKKPLNIDEFIQIKATRIDGIKPVPIDNFSYMQAWYKSQIGFINFFTQYNYPVKRTICMMTSADGIQWSSWQRLAAIGEGHYQISAVGRRRAGSAFNYHPQGKGLNWRTNLYYIETSDLGETWQNAAGRMLTVPLMTMKNDALVKDYKGAGLNVYLKDIVYDANDRPIILYLTSRGYQAGPENDPRWWMIAYWKEDKWQLHKITTSDNNYDMGSLWLTEDGKFHLIAPTEPGPQPYNPGGEIVHWLSPDSGKTWFRNEQLTRGSKMNHTYVRRPVNAHPDFFAFWADGHGREPSDSSLYFSDLNGKVDCLPRKMQNEMEGPILINR